MRKNWKIKIIGEKVILVPYRYAHVKKYHEWMQDEYLQEMTASEPLTLEEEYAMQTSWRDDETKCTFIILDPSIEGENKMAGDVNLYFNDSDEPTHGEIEIMIAEKNCLRKGLATEALLLMMKYASTELNTKRFIAKISNKNDKSLNLFQEKLFYNVHKKVDVFEETHLECFITCKEDDDNNISNMLQSIKKYEIVEDMPKDKPDIIDEATPSRLQRWAKGWNSGRYSVPGQGFHQADVHPYLAKHFSLLQLNPNDDIFQQQRVLIPLCGKTVDMIYFARDKKISAIGLEGIPRAINEFDEIVNCSKEKDKAILHKDAQHHWKPSGNGFIGIVEGDALNFKVDDKGAVDAIWDRAALIALSPEDRAAYVSMLNQSLKAGGRVLLTVVEHDMMMSPKEDESSNNNNLIPYGPPYSFTSEDVRSLYIQFDFTFLEELEREDKLENETRWKEKGATIFQEVCYLFEKKK